MVERHPRGRTDDQLVDLEAVRADDALISALAAGRRDVDGDELTGLIVRWRDSVDARPHPEHPDLDEAAAALSAAPQGWARRRFSAVALAPLTAAAVVGAALLGIGIAAHSSAPGDPLWGVSKTLFAEHSRSVQAATDVRSDLDQASAALDKGSTTEAKQILARAAGHLMEVDPDEGRTDLMVLASVLTRRAERESGRAGSSSTTSTAPTASPSAVPTTTPTAPPARPTTGSAPSPDRFPLPSKPPPTGVEAPPAVAPTTPPVVPTVIPSPTGQPTSPPPAPSSPPPAPTTAVPPVTTTEAPPAPPDPPTTTVAPEPTSPPDDPGAAGGGNSAGGVPPGAGQPPPAQASA